MCSAAHIRLAGQYSSTTTRSRRRNINGCTLRLAARETSDELQKARSSRGPHAENPPGPQDSGSAWELPEIQAVIADAGSSTVEFNTCAYQTQQKRRWFKPARWIGKLESSASLAKVCKCQLWVQHVPVVRKGNTAVAGAYPPDLTDATAKKIIEAWKRILNLEWL